MRSNYFLESGLGTDGSRGATVEACNAVTYASTEALAKIFIPIWIDFWHRFVVHTGMTYFGVRIASHG